MEVKIQDFAEPPRLDLKLEHEPNSTLTPELLIYYIGESRPNTTRGMTFCDVPFMSQKVKIMSYFTICDECMTKMHSSPIPHS